MEGAEKENGISIKESIKLVFILILMQFGINFIIGIGEGLLYMILEYINLTELRKHLDIYSGLVIEIGVWIYCIRYIKDRINFKENFRLKIKNTLKIKYYFCAILFLFGYILLFGNTIGLLLDKIPESKWVTEAFEEELINPIIGFISISIVAPIFEEVFFRGIILDQLSNRYSSFKAIMVSSALFGLIHFNIHQGINAFFIGFVLGYVYIKTNSILLSIFMHFVNNSLYTIIGIFNGINDQSIVQFNWIEIIIGAILLFISYRIFNRIQVDTNEIVEVNCTETA